MQLKRGHVAGRISVVVLGALLLLGGCGEPADTPAAPSEPETTSTAAAAEVGTSTTGSTDTTFPIEVVKFAEATGASLEEAAALLYGQVEQGEGLQRLIGLVGDDVIVDAAFDAYPRSDELTVFVAEEDAVAVVEASLTEAGLHPAKTFVEVGSAEPPYDPWDWQREQPYAGYEWLESPGPHLFGAWELVESNGDAPAVALLAGFGPEWGLEACSSWLGKVVTSSEGNVTLTVDTANPDCGAATAAVEQLVLSVIRGNGSGFEVSSEGDERMTWRSPTGDTLVWQPLNEFLEPEPLFSVYPESRSEIYEIWARSPAPKMEGIWYLQEVGNEDPAAPVSINVGVSTIGFEGQCNDMGACSPSPRTTDSP